MSVRKVYQVLVNGNVVFSGSYGSCVSCYESIKNSLDLFPFEDYGDGTVPIVLIAFAPGAK